MTDLATYFALAALVAILCEWSYVILWTRTLGKRILSGLLGKASSLRTGRGKNPTLVESIANAQGNAAAEENAEGQARIDDLLDLAAERLGVDRGNLAALAQQYLGPASGRAGGASAGVGVAGGPPALPAGNLLGAILRGVMDGSVSIEDALTGAAPYFLQGIRQKMGSPQSPPSAGFW